MAPPCVYSMLNQLSLCVQRLQAKVLKLVDISYGGENGFNQAIELSAEVLSNVKFIQEKKLIGGCLRPHVCPVLGVASTNGRGGGKINFGGGEFHEDHCLLCVQKRCC